MLGFDDERFYQLSMQRITDRAMKLAEDIVESRLNMTMSMEVAIRQWKGDYDALSNFAETEYRKAHPRRELTKQDYIMINSQNVKNLTIN